MAIDHVTGFNRSIQTGYNQISLDMPLSAVKNLMRSEGTRSPEFRLTQLAGYELEYAAAAHSGAKYFISWHNGVDRTYTIGFDNHDKVIYKAQGDS